jgi:RsiW-degrading membrane proteinase PrsW (M82 family)
VRDQIEICSQLYLKVVWRIINMNIAFQFVFALIATSSFLVWTFTYFFIYSTCNYYFLCFMRLYHLLIDNLFFTSFFSVYLFIYTILKAPVSTIVLRHLFTNNPSQLFQINPLHAQMAVRHEPDVCGPHNSGPGTSCRPADCAKPVR